MASLSGNLHPLLAYNLFFHGLTYQWAFILLVIRCNFHRVTTCNSITVLILFFRFVFQKQSEVFTNTDFRLTMAKPRQSHVVIAK